jgi:hypothetical protein
VRAELDEIVDRYRAQFHQDGHKSVMTREEAIKRIRKLGFSAGDAMRWLGKQPPRR